ncbi:hypothetical protein ABIC83_003052 [Roseateles asaccharophilus]|uniref:hypothetical protein n=1 Tax=Roseateles asaccharophilus TaxID=582607 RepID=UPI003837C33D
MTGVRQSIAGDNVMREIEPDFYRSDSGFVMRRETGLMPNGNPISNRWVLRDATGAWIDFDQYQHDLMARNNLRPNY